jgi:hypothetical protein
VPDKWPARAKPHQSLRMECHARSVAPVSAGRPFPAESAPAAHFDASRGRAAKGCHCRSRWQARRGRRRGSTRRRVPPGFARDSLLEQRRFELTVPPPCRDAGGLARRKESPRGDRVQPHGSLLTRRWSKEDSNRRSHCGKSCRSKPRHARVCQQARPREGPAARIPLPPGRSLSLH